MPGAPVAILLLVEVPGAPISILASAILVLAARISMLTWLGKFGQSLS